MSGSATDMPAGLDEILQLERDRNNTTEFLACWARLLSRGKTSCPEREYGFKIDIDAETRERIARLYASNKDKLDDKETRDKFRETLLDIVKKRKLKEFHDTFDVLDEGKIDGTIVTCNGCGTELDIVSFLWKHFHKEIYQCPICKEFYCYQCMRMVFIDLYDHAIKQGTSFEMEKGACKNCFERDLKGTLVKLIEGFDIKKRW